MKKFLGILVALSLLLCAMPLAAGAEETVTLYWWFRGNGEQADTELVNAKVNEMLKTYEGLENVEIVLRPFAASDYQTQVTLGLSSGEPMATNFSMASGRPASPALWIKPIARCLSTSTSMPLRYASPIKKLCRGSLSFSRRATPRSADFSSSEREAPCCPEAQGGIPG